MLKLNDPKQLMPHYAKWENKKMIDNEGAVPVSADKLAELAIAVWRLEKRTRRDATPEPVLIACETAMDRLHDLGVTLRDHVGDVCDDAMKVRVVEDVTPAGKADPAPLPRIVECLSPAVYHDDRLIRRAEVIVER